MDGLERLARVFTGLHRRELRISATGCTRLRSPKSSCSACVDVCPQKAIAIDAGAMSVSPLLCDDCGLCAASCPNGVFAVGGDHPSAAIPVHPGDPVHSSGLLVTCERIPAATSETYAGHQGAVTVPCLGVVDAAFVGTALERGWPEVDVAPAPCSACTRAGDGADMAQAAASRLPATKVVTAVPESVSGDDGTGKVRRGLLAGLLRRQEDQPQEPDDDERISRRQFFTGFVGRVAPDRPRSAVDSEAAPGTEVSLFRAGMLTTGVPLQRVRLIEMASAADRPPLVDQVLASATFDVSLDAESCDMCEVCSRLCPAGALVSALNGSQELVFHPRYCGGCNLCAEVCPKGAMTVARAPETDVERFLSANILLTKSLAACERCGENIEQISNKGVFGTGTGTDATEEPCGSSLCMSCRAMTRADSAAASLLESRKG